MKDLFTPSGCLSRDALLAYVSGKCTADDTRRIEQHLADCPLCSDAVEGIMEMADPLVLPALLEETRERLFGEGSEKKTVVVPITVAKKARAGRQVYYYSIAATIAVIVVSFFAIRYVLKDTDQAEISMLERTEDSGIAQKETVAETPASGSEYEEITVAEEKNKEGSAGTGKPYNAVDLVETSNGAGDLTNEYFRFGQNVTRDNDGYKEIVDEVLFKDDENNAMADKVEPYEDGTATKDQEEMDDASGEVLENKQVNTVVVERSKIQGGARKGQKKMGKSSQPAAAVATADPAQEDLNLGMESYNRGDYPGAVENFDRALKTSPDQDQALYYSGMSYFYSGNYDDALKTFRKLMKKKTGTYYQAAQWQIAVIQLKTGELKDARKTLNEVIDENGTYRSRAEEEIEKLNE